jgi:ATP-dependent DNA helicase RecG
VTELKDVKSIGPKSLSLLNKINIHTIEDLVTHYPFRYDVLRRTDLKTVTDPEQKIVVDGKVESVPLVIRFRGGTNKLNFRLSTVNGMVGVSIFGRAFLKQSLPIGEKIIVIGKYDSSKNIINASDIKFGALTNQDRIESVYHTTSGLSQKVLAGAINNALMTYGNVINDNIPKYLLDKYNFLNIVLDRINGIDLDTIVEATNIINPILDEYDLISDEYILDISSKERG